MSSHLVIFDAPEHKDDAGDNSKCKGVGEVSEHDSSLLNMFHTDYQYCIEYQCIQSVDESRLNIKIDTSLILLKLFKIC